MAWFRKEEKESELKTEVERPLPTNYLPKLPELPGSREVKTDSEMQSIKQNISPPKTFESPTLPHLEKPITSGTITSPPPIIAPTVEETGPIFIKIDKFKDASQNFEKIKEKVNDIEDMLEKIKQIKQKEDQELKEWEHEIQLIKTRIDSIDDSLFKKL